MLLTLVKATFNLHFLGNHCIQRMKLTLQTCQFQVSLRTLQASAFKHEASDDTAVVLHRQGFNGCYKPVGMTCSTNGGKVSKRKIFLVDPLYALKKTSNSSSVQPTGDVSGAIQLKRETDVTFAALRGHGYGEDLHRVHQADGNVFLPHEAITRVSSTHFRLFLSLLLSQNQKNVEMSLLPFSRILSSVAVGLETDKFSSPSLGFCSSFKCAVVCGFRSAL